MLNKQMLTSTDIVDIKNSFEKFIDSVFSNFCTPFITSTTSEEQKDILWKQFLNELNYEHSFSYEYSKFIFQFRKILSKTFLSNNQNVNISSCEICQDVDDIIQKKPNLERVLSRLSRNYMALLCSNDQTILKNVLDLIFNSSTRRLPVNDRFTDVQEISKTFFPDQETFNVFKTILFDTSINEVNIGRGEVALSLFFDFYPCLDKGDLFTLDSRLESTDRINGFKLGNAKVEVKCGSSTRIWFNRDTLIKETAKVFNNDIQLLCEYADKLKIVSPVSNLSKYLIFNDLAKHSKKLTNISLKTLSELSLKSQTPGANYVSIIVAALKSFDYFSKTDLGNRALLRSIIEQLMEDKISYLLCLKPPTQKENIFYKLLDLRHAIEDIKDFSKCFIVGLNGTDPESRLALYIKWK